MKSLSLPAQVSFAAKIQDYVQLTKLRLTSLVIFSSAMGFVIATRGNFQIAQLIWLIVGGFFVTGASNAFNQIIEQNYDAMMERTRNRPLPAGRMQTGEALISSILMAIAGVSILWIFLNPFCATLAAASMLIYTFIYTPAKRKTPFSVLIGAVPGAFPPLLGYIAATNQITYEALLLYAIQFIWQFPHFWAIAWVMDDDYKRAGFKMLPSGGRDRQSAFQTMAYTLCLIPLAFLPNFFGFTSSLSTSLIIVSGVFFAAQSFKLYKKLDIKSAQQLMFGSFIYLPVVQIVIMIDKLIH